jgi:hypothetical protein
MLIFLMAVYIAILNVSLSFTTASMSERRPQ